MESNQTNPGTNILEYFKRLINNWIICPLQAVLDPSRILDHLEEISRKVQEVQTAITELEEKFEDLPRKIQEAEIAITDLKEKLKEMRILEETMEFGSLDSSGHTTSEKEASDDDFKDETE